MNELLNRIKDIHENCYTLIINSMGQNLEVAGNIGVFCQNDKEFVQLKKLQKILTKESDNQNQKYFELLKPITIKSDKGLPEAIYTHLYIRKPDPTPYGKYKGDIDFIMATKDYELAKQNVKSINGAELYDRPGWDTIQITSPEVSSVAYISTKEFSKKVRVKFD